MSFSKEDKKSVLIGTAFNVIGGISYASFKIFSFALRMIFGGNAFGIYFIAYSLMELCSQFMLSGFGDAMVFHGSKAVHGNNNKHQDKANKNVPNNSIDEKALYRVIATSFRSTLLIALTMSGIAFFGANILYQTFWTQHDIIIIEIIEVLFWALPLMAIMYIPAEATKIDLEMRWSVLVVQIVFPMTSIVIALGLHYLLDYGIIAMAYGIISGIILGIPISLYGYSKHFNIIKTVKAIFVEPFDKDVISFAIPQSVNMMSNFGLVRLDSLMLSVWLPANAIGVYGLVSEITQLIRYSKVSFSGIFNPLVSKYKAMDNYEGLKQALFNLVQITSLLSVPLVILIMSFYPDVIVKGEAWEYSRIFPWLLISGPIMSCFFGLAGNLLLMTGHAKMLLFNSIISGGLNLLLNWILIPKYGLLGAAIATAISNVCISCMQIFEMYKLENIKFHFSLYKKVIAIYAVIIFPVIWVNTQSGFDILYASGFQTAMWIKASIALILILITLAIVLFAPGERKELEILKKIWNKSFNKKKV